MQLERASGLCGFLGRVEQRVDQAILDGRFDPTQRDLLLRSAAHYRPRTHHNPLGDPLAIFYLIARAHRDALDEQAVELGVFCHLYLLALDLLDDVQDDDLSGKPHADVGAAMALNDALTLLFLGLSALERCMRLEPSPHRRLSYLKIVNRVALTTGRGQHVDLMGEKGARSPSEVLDMQREKTASLTLICECAALYSHLTEAERGHYRVLGENLSLLVQVLDDVRDVYGKRRSPDLEAGKMTYPLACFLELADAQQRARLAALRSQLPGSLREIRQLFYDTGTLQRVAERMEVFRRAIHAELASFGEEAGTHRLLLFVVDHLVESVYRPGPVPLTSRLRAPETGWHARVKRLAREIHADLAPHGASEPPPLLPWHLPQWMYDKSRGVIFYPDIEGLPDETLAFHAVLLGEEDLAEVATLVERHAPAVLAHELFHHYRDVIGELSDDKWLEELAANTLAVAYCTAHAPAALASGLELAERVLSRPELALGPEAEQKLRELLDPERVSRAGGYGLDAMTTALVQLAMIRELARAPESLASAAQRWLSKRSAAA